MAIKYKRITSPLSYGEIIGAAALPGQLILAETENSSVIAAGDGQGGTALISSAQLVNEKYLVRSSYDKLICMYSSITGKPDAFPALPHTLQGYSIESGSFTPELRGYNGNGNAQYVLLKDRALNDVHIFIHGYFNITGLATFMGTARTYLIHLPCTSYIETGAANASRFNMIFDCTKSGRFYGCPSDSGGWTVGYEHVGLSRDGHTCIARNTLALAKGEKIYFKGSYTARKGA